MMGCHFVLQLALLIATSIYVADAQDILGCGGFLKSDVPLDFSRVHVSDNLLLPTAVSQSGESAMWM